MELWVIRYTYPECKEYLCNTLIISSIVETVYDRQTVVQYVISRQILVTGRWCHPVQFLDTRDNPIYLSLVHNHKYTTQETRICLEITPTLLHKKIAYFPVKTLIQNITHYTNSYFFKISNDIKSILEGDLKFSF